MISLQIYIIDLLYFHISSAFACCCCNALVLIAKRLMWWFNTAQPLLPSSPSSLWSQPQHRHRLCSISAGICAAYRVPSPGLSRTLVKCPCNLQILGFIGVVVYWWWRWTGGDAEEFEEAEKEFILAPRTKEHEER